MQTKDKIINKDLFDFLDENNLNISKIEEIKNYSESNISIFNKINNLSNLDSIIGPKLSFFNNHILNKSLDSIEDDIDILYSEFLNDVITEIESKEEYNKSNYGENDFNQEKKEKTENKLNILEEEKQIKLRNETQDSSLNFENKCCFFNSKKKLKKRRRDSHMSYLTTFNNTKRSLKTHYSFDTHKILNDSLTKIKKKQKIKKKCVCF